VCGQPVKAALTKEQRWGKKEKITQALESYISIC